MYQANTLEDGQNDVMCIWFILQGFKTLVYELV